MYPTPNGPAKARRRFRAGFRKISRVQRSAALLRKAMLAGVTQARSSTRIIACIGGVREHAFKDSDVYAGAIDSTALAVAESVASIPKQQHERAAFSWRRVVWGWRHQCVYAGGCFAWWPSIFGGPVYLVVWAMPRR